MDKAFWQDIIKNNYQLPENQSLPTLTEELLSYLSSTDPELRDTFAYGILARWIITHQYYSTQQLLNIVSKLSPKLSDRLGNQGDDSIFGRSYAALILSLIVYHENRANFMTQAELRALLDQARRYLISEHDLRAYVPQKGWANACAHTADLIKFIARNNNLEAEDIKRILDTIGEKVLAVTNTVYNHDEDERLAAVVMAVINHSSLTVYELSDWLNHFSDWKSSHTHKDDYDESYHATYQNIRNFLRSLYIQMQLIDSIPVDAADFEPELLNVIGEYSL